MKQHEEILEKKNDLLKSLEQFKETLKENNIKIRLDFNGDGVTTTKIDYLNDMIIEATFEDENGNEIDIREDECHNDEIQKGDYVISCKDNLPSLAQIYENSDGKFQLIYPKCNMINNIIGDSPKELYESYNKLTNHGCRLVKVENKRVENLIVGESYFLCNENEVHVVKCTKIKDEFNYYALVENTFEILTHPNVDDLYACVFLKYDIVKQLRKSSEKEYISDLLDSELPERLADLMLETFDNIYEYLKLDNIQLYDLGCDIIQKSGLSRKEIIDSINYNEIANEDLNMEIIDVINKYLNLLSDEYFYDANYTKWFPRP